MLMRFTVLFSFLFAFFHPAKASSSGEGGRLEERFAWKQVDFQFEDENSRQEALRSGEFVPANNLPLGLEVWRDKLFVTLPRWKKGIPATLTYVPLLGSNDAAGAAVDQKSPKLVPYPNWESHRGADQVEDKQKAGSDGDSGKTKITSVFRVNVDICDRLWIVDDGVADIFGEGKRVHDPRIIVYDLKNGDRLIKRYTLPKKVFKEGASFLANIVVDVPHCGDKAGAFAYVPDLSTNALIVYDMANDDSWRVTHHYFHFDPLAGDFNIDGINFQWTDGIFGVALSPPSGDSHSYSKTLYFHPMASTREFSVPTSVLRNKTAATSGSAAMFHQFKPLGSRGPNTQSSASSMDRSTGILFYTLLNKNAVGCWNSRKYPDEYSADTNAIIASDPVTMIFPNDLKVDKNSTLWVLTDRLSTLLYSSLNASDVNFRIFSAPVKSAVQGTVCDFEEAPNA